MKFRSTWLMMALVALLAAYTAWEYRKAGREAVLGSEEEKIFTFNSEDVSQVKMVRGGETVLLVRDGSEWKMKQPVEDWAENSAVEALLYSLVIQKGKKFRDGESQDVKWAEFGLDPAGTRIEVTFGKGKSETLLISSKNAFDGSYYLRYGDQLLLGDHGIAQVVGRDAKQMRSKRLFRDRDGEVESGEIFVDSGDQKDKFSLKRTGDRLEVEPKPDFKIDDTRLANWLTNLLAVTPTDIVSDTLGDDEKHADLLVKPSFTAQVKYKKTDGSPGDWRLTMGQDKAGDTFMFTNLRDTIYKNRSAGIENLRIGRGYFRDGKSAFKFAVEQAHEVEVANGAFKHKFTKDGSTWKLAAGEAPADFNADKLAGLFHGITSLEGQEFSPATKAPGFKPDQRVVIRDSVGKVLLELSWGDLYKAKEPYNHGLDYRFVKTNLEKDAMGVSAAKVASLIDARMVIPKAQPKNENKK